MAKGAASRWREIGVARYDAGTAGVVGVGTTAVAEPADLRPNLG